MVLHLSYSGPELESKEGIFLGATKLKEAYGHWKTRFSQTETCEGQGFFKWKDVKARVFCGKVWSTGFSQYTSVKDSFFNGKEWRKGFFNRKVCRNFIWFIYCKSINIYVLFIMRFSCMKKKHKHFCQEYLSAVHIIK